MSKQNEYGASYPFGKMPVNNQLLRSTLYANFEAQKINSER